jgi:hypothetical protein
MLRMKGKVVTYGEIWLHEEAPTPPGVDILVCRQRLAPLPGIPSKPFLTIVNDIGGGEEAVMGSFAKDCRYQIRRAGKDGLSAEFITDPAGRLDEFCEFFEGFASRISIKPASRLWLDAAREAGRLVLSSASCRGEVLVWHAYLVTGDLCYLEHSASYFRGGNGEYTHLVGRANRWLTWQDIVAFRACGITRYDWGGLWEDESTPERAGINGFKKSFGGRPERRWEYALPVTALGRMYLPLRGAWLRWRSPEAPAPAAATA